MKTIRTNVDLGLMLIRLALGTVFVMHGWQKLSVMGLAGVAGFLTTLGIPVPSVSAALLIAAELGGGLLMLAGLFTRPVAFVLAGEMAAAYYLGHMPRGRWPILNVGELAILYCFIWLFFAAAGAGPLSLDKLIRRVR